MLVPVVITAHGATIGIVHIPAPPSVEAEEILRFDKIARLVDDMGNAPCQIMRRKGFHQKFGNAGIARFFHARPGAVARDKDDGDKTVGKR